MEKSQNIEEKQEKLPPPQAEKPHAREQLPMEKKFNKLAYGGISFLAQAVTGSALTYWIKYSSGRPVYDKIAKWVGPNFIEKFGKYKGAEAVGKADSFITIATMVMVGNMFLIPLKILENKRNEIVAKWTKADNEKRTARGDAPSEDELKHQQELIAELDNAPKQSWTSLGLGRTFALATVFTADRVMENAGANAALENLTKNTTKGIANSVGLKKLAEWKPFERVSSLAFYDGFYSMISAAGLFVYSHFVVPPKKTEKNDASLQDTIAPAASLNEPPAPTPLSFADAALAQKANPRAIIESKTKSESFAARALASQASNDNLQVGA